MLTSTAVLSIWHDIEPASRGAYMEWHVLEHMTERLSIPGFVRGRRGVAVDPHQSPQYITLYEAESLDVFRSEPYLDRLDHPTPWTQTVQPGFQNFVRYANEIETQRGHGDGAYVTTARFETRAGTGADPGAAADAGASFEAVRGRLEQLLEEIGALPFVASVALARSVDEITDYATEETELRPVNPELEGVSHLALVCAETVTPDAAGRVRDALRIAAAGLDGVELGLCATYVVDYAITASQTAREPIGEAAVEIRRQATE